MERVFGGYVEGIEVMWRVCGGYVEGYVEGIEGTWRGRRRKIVPATKANALGLTPPAGEFKIISFVANRILSTCSKTLVGWLELERTSRRSASDMK